MGLGVSVIFYKSAFVMHKLYIYAGLKHRYIWVLNKGTPQPAEKCTGTNEEPETHHFCVIKDLTSAHSSKWKGGK